MNHDYNEVPAVQTLSWYITGLQVLYALQA